MVDADHRDDRSDLSNGELATQIVGSIVFTVGFYLPLKNILGAVQPMSSYAQYLTPLDRGPGDLLRCGLGGVPLGDGRPGGINRRFRAMPMARLTLLAARMTASVYRCVVALVVSLVRLHHRVPFPWRTMAYRRFRHTGAADRVALALMGDRSRGHQEPRGTPRRCWFRRVVTLGLASVGLQPVERFPTWIQPFVRDQAAVTVAQRVACPGRRYARRRHR